MSKTVQNLIDDYKNGVNSIDNAVVEKVVNDKIIKDINDFKVIFNAPTIVNTKLIFSAEITKDTGVMFNGNLKSSANIQNENADTVKSVLATIKVDTITAMKQLDANKDWYK